MEENDDCDDVDVATDELDDDVPTDDDTEEEKLADELLETEETLLELKETDDEDWFGLAGVAGIAGIAGVLFVVGVAGMAGVAGMTGRTPDVTTPILQPPPAVFDDADDANFGVMFSLFASKLGCVCFDADSETIIVVLLPIFTSSCF